LAIGIAVLGAAPTHAADPRFEYHGEQGRIIEAIERSSKAHDYAPIIALLDRDYSDLVSTQRLLKKSQELDWELSVTYLGTSQTFIHFAFVPIRAKVRYGQRESGIDSVLFFRITDGKWTLINFPFLPDYFPSFGSIPVLNAER